MFWWQNFSENWASARILKSYAVWPDRWHSIRGLLPWNVKKSVFVYKSENRDDHIIWTTSSNKHRTRSVLETFVPLAWQHLQASLDQSCIIYFSLLFAFTHLQISPRREWEGKITFAWFFSKISNIIIKHWPEIGSMFPGKVWANIPSLSKVRRLDSSYICSWFLC